jgi:hypothetical protein
MSARCDICDGQGARTETGVPYCPHDDVTCDDCEAVTDWRYAIQLDPWERPTGEVLCESCAMKRWERYQERLMEET